jgi:hypothetical protein
LALWSLPGREFRWYWELFVRGRWLAGVLSGLFVVSGCTSSVAGRAVPAATTTAVDQGICRAADLMRCIVAAPAGSSAYATPLGPNGVVSTQQFISAFYPADAQHNHRIADQLREQGLVSVAHRNWAASGSGDQVDIVLLGFATAGGAQSRARTVETSTRRDPTLGMLAGAGLPSGVVAFVDRTVDRNGNIGVRAYAAFGVVEMEFNYLHPATLDSADLIAQVTREVQLLTG